MNYTKHPAVVAAVAAPYVAAAVPAAADVPSVVVVDNSFMLFLLLLLLPISFLPVFLFTFTPDIRAVYVVHTEYCFLAYLFLM